MSQADHLRDAVPQNQSCRVHDWSGLLDVYNSFRKREEAKGRKGPTWIFRGQQRYDWPLEPVLERLISRYKLPKKRAADLEGRLLREFQRKAHHYITTPLPEPRDTIP